MVDISRFAPPEDKSAPDISRFAPPDISRFAPPEKKESSGLDTAKDVAVGFGTSLAEPVLGLGELVPGPIGRASARGSQAVEKAYRESANRSPVATRAGYIPGLVGTAFVPGGAAFKLSEGAGLLGRALATGAGAGLGGFALTPTGKEDYGQRMGEKGEAGLVSGTIGAALPAVPGVYKAGKKAVQYGQKAFGKEGDVLAEQAAQKAKDVARGVESTAEKAKVAPTQKEIAANKALQQVGGREPVAEARQVARDKKVNSALDSFGKTKTLDEDLGGLIQNKGRSNVQELSKARETTAIEGEKNPAFERARSRETGGDHMVNNPKSAPILNEAFADLETQINRTTEPYRGQLQARLQSLKGKEVPLSQNEINAEKVKESIVPGYVAKTTKQEPMTLDQAEFMRRMLTDKDLAEQSGFSALDVARRTDIAKKLRAAMDAYEPGVGEYLSKYQAGSIPINKALAGRGESLIDAQKLAEDEVLFSADKASAAKYYLDGSAERAQKLLDLTGGKSHELVESIKGNLRTQMENMSSKQAKDFIGKNEGLLRVFPEFRSGMEKIAEAKSVAETAGVKATQKAKSDVARLTGESSEAKAARETQEKLATKYGNLATQIEEASPKDAIAKSTTLINKMRGENLIDEKLHRELLQQIEMAKNAYGESEKAKQTIWALIRKTGLYSGLGLGGVAGYYGLKAVGD